MTTLVADPVAVQTAAVLQGLRSIEARLSAPAPRPSPLRVLGRNVLAAGDWTALTVDLPIAPLTDERWIVYRVTLHGEAAVNPQNAQSPCSGIFLISPGTRPESLADGQAGWSVDARGVPMPAGIVVNYSFLPASGRYAYVISLTQSSPQPIDSDTTIRGVLSCNPGSAQPGPGGGSFGILTVMGYRESFARGR